MRAARAAALSALLASTLAAGGCFKPNIKDGALFCADGACPDGYMCATNYNPPRCYRIGYHFDAGATGGGGGGGTSGTGGMGGMGTGGNLGTGGMDAACLGPVASCTPGDAGMCDPVCNTGCGKCYEKCSVDPVGDLTCKRLSTSGTPAGILTMCQVSQSSSDPTTHSDNCQPGSACISHNACGPRCYQFCRTKADCEQTTGLGSTCTIDAGGGQSFCDVPTANCNPVNGAAGVSPRYSGCPLAVQGCYLSGESGNLTCDCYNLPGARQGETCSHSRDCFPGLVCTDPTSISGKHCFKVCRLPSPDGGADLTRPDAGESGCSDYRNCIPIQLTNGTQRSTYGFCNE